MTINGETVKLNSRVGVLEMMTKGWQQQFNVRPEQLKGHPPD